MTRYESRFQTTSHAERRGKKLKKVTFIAPNNGNAIHQPKLRVAAYARVSTDSEDQLVSLETQKSHYQSTIMENPAWEFAGIYYDEGITGTKKERRPALLQMMKDCEKQHIDLIMTKSISRFARNTVDCLALVRRLTKLGISVYFESENINTGAMESELMLSILSGLAEGESASIAENNRWSIQRRFQNGTYKIGCPAYGYDAVNGDLIVNKQQAEIVRFIFSAVLSGKGVHRIAKDLNACGLKSKNGGRWTSSTIRGMIRNEKYVGDAIFQKTYSDSQFIRFINRGEREQYLIRDHHEAIIRREDYDAAQRVTEQRGKEKNVERQSGKYQNRYPFSGKIICHACGATFKRRIHASGKKYVAWCCHTHITEIMKCSMKYIPHSTLEYAFVTMMNKLIFGHHIVLKPLLIRLRDIDSKKSLETIQEIDKKIADAEEQRKVLMGLQTRGYLEPAVYTRGNNALLQEVQQLQRRKESFIRFISNESRHLSEVGALLQFSTKATLQTGFNGDLFSQFVAHIIVYSRMEIGFVLKCGITLKEKLVK